MEYQSGNDDEELDIEFDKQLSKLVKFVRIGRNDKKPLFYEVSTKEHKDGPFSDDYSMSVEFTVDKEDLVFVMRIMDTTFKLNLSHNSGIE